LPDRERSGAPPDGSGPRQYRIRRLCRGGDDLTVHGHADLRRGATGHPTGGAALRQPASPPAPRAATGECRPPSTEVNVLSTKCITSAERYL
jgi:hypothetical protein